MTQDNNGRPTAELGHVFRQIGENARNASRAIREFKPIRHEEGTFGGEGTMTTEDETDTES